MCNGSRIKPTERCCPLALLYILCGMCLKSRLIRVFECTSENKIVCRLLGTLNSQYPYLYGINVCIIMQTDSFLIPLVVQGGDSKRLRHISIQLWNTVIVDFPFHIKNRLTFKIGDKHKQDMDSTDSALVTCKF